MFYCIMTFFLCNLHTSLSEKHLGIADKNHIARRKQWYLFRSSSSKLNLSIYDRKASCIIGLVVRRSRIIFSKTAVFCEDETIVPDFWSDFVPRRESLIETPKIAGSLLWFCLLFYFYSAEQAHPQHTLWSVPITTEANWSHKPRIST